MSAFHESQLEQVFVELFQKEGYDYVYGESISRDTRDVILYDDLRFYLRKKYEVDHITEDEINRAIARLETSDGGSVYAENVEVLRLLQEGFSLKRTNPKLPNLHIYPIDYTEVDNNELGKNNIFKFVNQLVIDGEHHRIPDGIVFVNGLPLVVLEFKNAIKQNTTIENAFKQLTVRYRRDIPKLFRYNAFVW